jgi:hypothetical protein
MDDDDVRIAILELLDCAKNSEFNPSVLKYLFSAAAFAKDFLTKTKKSDQEANKELRDTYEDIIKEALLHS